MPQVGHSRPVTVRKRTGRKPELSVRAEPARVRLQRSRHDQKPRQTRPPRPEANSESANPAVDEQDVAGSRVALRLNGRFSADRARMRGL